MGLIPRYSDCPECAAIAEQLKGKIPNAELQEIKSSALCFHKIDIKDENDLLGFLAGRSYYIPSILSRLAAEPYLNILKQYLELRLMKNTVTLQNDFVQIWNETKISIDNKHNENEERQKHYQYNNDYDKYGLSHKIYDQLAQCGISAAEIQGNEREMKILLHEIKNDNLEKELSESYYSNDIEGYKIQVRNNLELMTEQSQKAYLNLIKANLNEDKFLNSMRLDLGFSGNTIRKEYDNDVNHKRYFLMEIGSFIDELLGTSQTETKPKQETPKSFDQLFYNKELVKPCIDILKELDPPLVDTDYNYIGKLKGVFCVWIDEMQRQGIVKHYSDRKIFASLIPQKIKRFSIDESMFGKHQSKAERLYKTDIKTKVSKIKLSQLSQKESGEN